MSQSSSIDRGDFRDDDLLSSFDPEVPAIPPEVPRAAPAAIAAASSDGQSVVAALSAKLDDATREIERSRDEVSALRGELATIVAKVRDIEWQVTRNREPVAPPAAATGRYGLLKSVTLALLVLANAFLWRPQLAAPTADPVQPTAGRVQPIDGGRAQTAEQDGAQRISESRALLIATPTVPVIAIPASQAPVAAALVSNPRPLPKRAADVVAAQPARPQEFFGTLAVQTSPPGAAVFVNRQPVGETPLQLPAMRAGSHLLWIERDGYQRWTRVVTVPADQVTNVNARLEPR